MKIIDYPAFEPLSAEQQEKTKALLEQIRAELESFVQPEEFDLILAEPTEKQLDQVMEVNDYCLRPVYCKELKEGPYQQVMIVPRTIGEKTIIMMLAGPTVDERLARMPREIDPSEEFRQPVAQRKSVIPSYEERAKRQERVPGHVRGGLNRYNFKRR